MTSLKTFAKKPRIIIPVIVVAAVLIAIGVSLYLNQDYFARIGIPNKLPAAETTELEMHEYGFDGASGGPQIQVNKGEQAQIALHNKGNLEHEFMIVKQKDAFLSEISNAVNTLQQDGSPGLEQIEESDRMESIHEKYSLGILNSGSMEGIHDIDVEPGEFKTVSFTMKETGTYWYVCAELSGSFPSSHADQGMFGKLIVKEQPITPLGR